MSDMRIPLEIKNRPVLDPGFVPFGPWLKAYEKEASRPVDIAVEREKGRVSVFHLKMRDAQWKEANFRWLERTVKFLLYSVGGYRIYLCGCDELGEEIRKHFSRSGERAFDADFMETVYEKPFEILLCDREHFPAESEEAISLGGHLGGCRIGFDAGGSDRKVSAVIDGETVYSEEVVWFPKLSEDPNYQYQGIVEAFKTAASKMPRVDAIGVSSAGVIVDNRPMVCSLFIKVPKERFEEVKSVYLRAAKEIGDVPLAVRTLKSGAADFITKPWDNDELIAKLLNVLEAQQQLAPLDEVEMEHIRRAVDRADGNLTAAAKMLGLTRQTLYNKLKAHP